VRAVVTSHCPRKLRPALSIERWIDRHRIAIKAPKNTSTLTQAQTWASAQTQNGCPKLKEKNTFLIKRKILLSCSVSARVGLKKKRRRVTCIFFWRRGVLLI